MHFFLHCNMCLKYVYLHALTLWLTQHFSYRNKIKLQIINNYSIIIWKNLYLISPPSTLVIMVVTTSLFALLEHMSLPFQCFVGSVLLIFLVFCAVLCFVYVFCLRPVSYVPNARVSRFSILDYLFGLL